MRPSPLRAGSLRSAHVVAFAFLLTASGCRVFDTFGEDGATGRGPKAFDPYAGPQSGAIKLSLQVFNGCAIHPTGERVGSGDTRVAFPAHCGDETTLHPGQPTSPGGKQRPLTLLTGTSYFLSQFMVMETVQDLHLAPSDLASPMRWIQSAGPFQHLDWSGFGLVTDEIVGSEKTSAPNAFDRIVQFGNAAWQRRTDDTFLLEVIDADGTVRTSALYERRDFFAENPVGGHTQLTWHYGPFGPPLAPGDLTPQPVPPPPPSAPPVEPLNSSTTARFELMGTTLPSRTVAIPALTGSGTLRLTWSQAPSAPFLFPVTFLPPADLGATCYAEQDPTTRVPCGFGLDPRVTFSTPANGEFYAPGERFEITLAAHDGHGNLLHAPARFPSWNEFIEDRANGLYFFNPFSLGPMRERDSVLGIGLSGPTQNMRPYYALDGASFLSLQDFVEGSTEITSTGFNVIPHPVAALGVVPGGRDTRPPTTYKFRVPEKAPPGTYSLVFKAHRAFAGERFSKASPFFFQVGQKERTAFPGRVGNCQLCHRGVTSLDNVRHGLPVDFVEGCKTCHNRDDFVINSHAQTTTMIHRLHLLSNKYPRAKNDCATCHLTRESTLPTTLAVCASCHATPHGGEFEAIALTTERDPNVALTSYSNCNQGCHELTPPTRHILPER